MAKEPVEIRLKRKEGDTLTAIGKGLKIAIPIVIVGGVVYVGWKLWESFSGIANPFGAFSSWWDKTFGFHPDPCWAEITDAMERAHIPVGTVMGYEDLKSIGVSEKCLREKGLSPLFEEGETGGTVNLTSADIQTLGPSGVYDALEAINIDGCRILGDVNRITQIVAEADPNAPEPYKAVAIAYEEPTEDEMTTCAAQGKTFNINTGTCMTQDEFNAWLGGEAFPTLSEHTPPEYRYCIKEWWNPNLTPFVQVPKDKPCPWGYHEIV